VGAAYALQPGAHAMAGRSPDMDIFLDDTFVSSKHALFEVGPDGLRVEDLRSTNGTQLNGVDISDSVPLGPGDRVEVGDTVFQVESR
jgi:pSer/pThr/pTyr-binding forkhead associated (FHA) protein